MPPTTRIDISGDIGNNSWYTSDVMVTLTAMDDEGGSGVKETEYSFDDTNWEIYSPPFLISSEGTPTVYYRSIDNANNIEETGSVIINIDKTPPVVMINIPEYEGEYLLNEYVLASWSANDQLSGIASAEGTVPTGEAINTATVGPKPFSVVAIDNAGNQLIESVTYYVKYVYSGILQPINPEGMSIFKLNSTIPVKFRLQDSNGAFVATAIARIYLAKISDDVTGAEIEAESTREATIGNLFRYGDDEQYIFNLGTKYLSVGTWQIRISLDDGSSKYVNISLR